MKKMNLNNIFNIFENKESIPEGNKNEKNLVDHFKDHPLVKIGHFKKLIVNYNSYGKKIVEALSQSNKDLELEDLKKAGEFILFGRAWEFIHVLDLNNSFHIECLNTMNSKDSLKKSIRKCLKYFEKVEEYEKCSFLKSLQDKLDKPKD